jgi:hypothetical protein
MFPFDEVPPENRRTTFGECNPCAVKTVHDVKSALRKLTVQFMLPSGRNFSRW